MRRRARTRWANRSALGLLVVVGLGAALLVLVAARLRTGSTAQPAPAVETYAVTENAHVTGPVRYSQDPPVGGRHAPVWQNCGFYAAEVPNEAAVHSMEHGAVWITYRSGLPATQLDLLRRLARDPAGRGYVLVSEYPTLPADTPVVASAWGKQQRLHSVDEAALRSFIGSFAAGPQTPEAGAPCSGGAGAPD